MTTMTSPAEPPIRTLPEGCHFDTIRGRYIPLHVIHLAWKLGWREERSADLLSAAEGGIETLDAYFGRTDDELQDAEDRATAFLQQFAPEGHTAGYSEGGDWGIWKDDEDEDTRATAGLPCVVIAVKDGVAEVITASRGVTTVLADYDTMDEEGEPKVTVYPPNETTETLNRWRECAGLGSEDRPEPQEVAILVNVEDGYAEGITSTAQAAVVIADEDYALDMPHHSKEDPRGIQVYLTTDILTSNDQDGLAFLRGALGGAS